MRTGRPLGWPLKGSPDWAFIDGLEVAGGERVTLPAEVRSGLPWLAVGQDVLSVLEEHGRVRLIDMAHRETVSARMQELPTGELHDPSASRLLTIQYRYRRVASWSDGRLVLPLTVTAHLDAVSQPGVVYIARAAERVELWSRATTEEVLLRGDSDRDLP